MDKEEIIRRLKKIAKHAIHTVGEPPLVLSLDDGVALDDAVLLLEEREPIKPTINEYGEAYCVCGENVGIIPSNKNLLSIRFKYCPECGRRMNWDD